MARRHHRRNAEEAIQIAVADHLRLRAVPGVVWTHPPNGGKRGLAEARRFKRMGVLPGVSDFLLWHDGKSYALELKAPGGRATESQLAFQAHFAKAGGYCCLAEGLDAALRTLEAWGILKGLAA